MHRDLRPHQQSPVALLRRRHVADRKITRQQSFCIPLRISLIPLTPARRACRARLGQSHRELAFKYIHTGRQYCAVNRFDRLSPRFDRLSPHGRPGEDDSVTIVTLAGYGTCLRQIPRAKIGSSTHPRVKHNHGMDSSVASAFYARSRCCHFHPLRWAEGAYLHNLTSGQVPSIQAAFRSTVSAVASL